MSTPHDPVDEAVSGAVLALADEGPLSLGPEMTIVHAAQHRDRLLQALHKGEAVLNLDLSEVNEADSSAVQLLLALQRSLSEQGRHWQLHGVGRPLLDLWALFGLPPLLLQD